MLLSAKQEASRLLGEDAEESRCGNFLFAEIKSCIEILTVNEKEMTLSGNHV